MIPLTAVLACCLFKCSAYTGGFQVRFIYCILSSCCLSLLSKNSERCGCRLNLKDFELDWLMSFGYTCCISTLWPPRPSPWPSRWIRGWWSLLCAVILSNRSCWTKMDGGNFVFFHERLSEGGVSETEVLRNITPKILAALLLPRFLIISRRSRTPQLECNAGRF